MCYLLDTPDTTLSQYNETIMSELVSSISRCDDATGPTGKSKRAGCSSNDRPAEGCSLVSLINQTLIHLDRLTTVWPILRKEAAGHPAESRRQRGRL